jgi:hypothetical protein
VASSPPQKLDDKSCTRSREINRSHQPKANRIPTRIDSPRKLPSSAADGFNNVVDCTDHELRLLLVYLVAAIGVR